MILKNKSWKQFEKNPIYPNWMTKKKKKKKNPKLNLSFLAKFNPMLIKSLNRQNIDFLSDRPIKVNFGPSQISYNSP